MHVTVVLCTFRRPAPLGRVLDGLAGQADPGAPWDVVVVDNEPAPGANATFATHAPRLPVAARLVREPRPGSAHARNRAMAEAAGSDVTVFLDDDVVPTPTWLRTLVEPVLADRADGTGGRVVLDPAVARPGWLDEVGIGGYLARFDPATEERDLRLGEFVITANAAFRTAILQTTGGFDVELGPRSGVPMVNDDVLISRRFQAAGGRVRYTPHAVVVHELPAERLRRRYLLRRAWAQGRSDWIVDRDALGDRRFGGARVALSWLGAELGRRTREGLLQPAVAFHAACDVARTAGALRQAAAEARRVHR